MIAANSLATPLAPAVVIATTLFICGTMFLGLYWEWLKNRAQIAKTIFYRWFK